MQDDTEDIETREREGSLGCGKVILDLVKVLVVILGEEVSLRSDTRLPLESSQYMAENF